MFKSTGMGVVAALGAALLLALPAKASTLIGDTVTIDYLFPNVSTVLSTGSGFPQTVTGAVGTSDRVLDGFSGGPYFGVNLEPSSIIVDFVRGTLFTPPAAFDGIRISGIDGTIAAVVAAGIAPSRITFGLHEVFINFQSLAFANGATVTADIQFQTPLPGALALFLGGGGLLGFFARRRKNKRENDVATPDLAAA